MAKRKKSKKPLWLKVIVILLIILIADLSWFMFVVDVKQYKNRNPVKTAFMKYREGQWKNKNQNITIKQIWVPLSSISVDARRAVVIAEDGKFWKHDGFDFDAMRKAMEKNLEKKKIAMGASTITMQLAKNLFLSPSKTPVRKVHEAILTWRIERTLSKRRILELYLNIAEWGNGIFGIEAASRTYFHHASSQLNKHEAALLAAVLPNPIRFNPLRNSRYVYKRSRLIRRALGGDVKAAIALHDDKKNAGSIDSKDTIKDSGLSDADTLLIKDSLEKDLKVNVQSVSTSADTESIIKEDETMKNEIDKKL